MLVWIFLGCWPYTYGSGPVCSAAFQRVFVQRTSGSVYFRQEPSEALAEQKGKLLHIL